MKYLKYFLIMLIPIIIITGCQKAPENKSTENKKKNNNSNPVMIEIMKNRDLNEYISITGKLEGITDILMSSEINGKVIDISKKLGDWVNKGEEIGRIDNSDYHIKLEQAKAGLLAAEAALEGAQMQMNASQSLYEKEIISQLEYSQSVSSFKNAQAGYNGAKAGVEQAKKAYDNSRFVAPVNGYISDLYLEIGQTVNNGTPICSIVNSKRLKIKTGVGEQNIRKIKAGQTVIVDYNNGEWTEIGKITGIGIKPTNNSANYPVEIELPNPDQKGYPGMVIEARILSNTFKEVLYTSLNNVMQQYDLRYVYTVSEDNKAIKKIVKLGPVIGENVIILEGLTAGDHLVTEGAENLEDNVEVDIRKQLN